MSDTAICNAVIERATIVNDDHGCLSAWLTLDYGDGGHQGFGGYGLYLPKSFTHHSLNVNYAGHFIYRVLEIAGVNDWGSLAGKTIRVKRPAGLGGTIQSIGHIVKNDWFDPQSDFAPFCKESR
jgi:hypothetical protein